MDRSIEPSPELLDRSAAAAGQAVRAGCYAPGFRLAAAQGGRVALVELIGRPVVLSFYRGLWCSHCDLALQALARIDDQIRALGARQIVIGPPPDGADQRDRLAALPMPILIDRGLRVAAAYGLTLSLPEPLRARYRDLGYVPTSAKWRVPIPATYIIDPAGRIAAAAIDGDYRNRLDPSHLLSALRALSRRGAGPA